MIQFERLNLTVGSFSLRDVSLHVREGEYFVLLGPTGSGKTLLVECLCGLNRIDSGRIVIGGVDVTRLEPRRRGIGYVPQDYGLFPHMTVRRNVRFGLDRQHGGGATGRDPTGKPMDNVAMSLVGIEHLGDRLPRKLSGGEKQRVALARALAIQPKVLLLDEPVSAVDEQTRDSLCARLKQLQRASGITAIHVCHSFAEMLAVADRVGIIHEGRIVQVGTPQEILDRPRSTMVARFVQAGNLFAAKARRDGKWLRLTCDNGLEFTAAASQTESFAGDVTAMVRPENLRIDSTRPENVAPESSDFEGTVEQVTHFGPIVKVRVAVQDNAELLVSLGKKEYDDRRVDVGARVYLSVAPEYVHVLQEQSETGFGLRKE
ncbi:MAG: ABC transporter ATP-binding protein [Thermoguttaceae bacterium]